MCVYIVQRWKTRARRPAELKRLLYGIVFSLSFSSLTQVTLFLCIYTYGARQLYQSIHCPLRNHGHLSVSLGCDRSGEAVAVADFLQTPVIGLGAGDSGSGLGMIKIAILLRSQRLLRL